MASKLPWWVIAYLKGGARKSTTCMFLAFALAERGEDVLVVDGDHGTQGVTDWATRVYADGGELPFHVVQWAPSQGTLLVPWVQRQQRETGARRVLVDLGGEAPEVLKQAVLAAGRVISPVGAEQGELGRVDATTSIVRPAGVPHGMLLTRVPQPRKGAARDAREFLTSTEGGRHNVFETEIPRHLELYSEVWGTVPSDLGAYADLADELLKAEQA